MRKNLGQILVEMKLVSPAQLKEALNVQQEDPSKRLGAILLETNTISEEQLLKALAKQLDHNFIRLNGTTPPKELVELFSRETCDRYCLVPVEMSDTSITVAMNDPLDYDILESLKFMLSKNIKVVVALRSDIEQAINNIYGVKAKAELTNIIEQATMTTEVKVRSDDFLDKEEIGANEDAPVIRFVQVMIQEALRSRASDIHVEPMEERVKIRYRIDGVLQEVNQAPKRLQGSLLSRIKIMGGMDIAEKRKPQDGRISVNIGGKALDIRVSSIPSAHGESIVMRLLDKEAGLVSMEDLGFHQTDYKRFKNIVRKPNGIILITGPTGSGKTTTLYATLKELNKPDKKIITAENPVEYHIEGINQSQVNEKIGLTFARILRAMLRQAPNIILVGEIRDHETAQIAIQAALTGHLVFSTLHTNDAPGALTRLLDMGVKPFLVASSIQAIMAQRLIRILCSCKQKVEEPDPATLKALNIDPEILKEHNISEPVGCPNCKDTGYKGRKGIFELMELDTALREMVFKREPHGKIREYAKMHGMVTLMEDGIRKTLAGVTSLDEILSITHREDIIY